MNQVDAAQEASNEEFVDDTSAEGQADGQSDELGVVLAYDGWSCW